MFAYCLYCWTTHCRLIADLLEKLGADRAFSPQITSCHRKKGKIEEAMYDLLPGYVFVYFRKQLEDFELFASINGIIRCLGSGEYGTKGLQGSDYKFAMDLYQNDGIINAITILKRNNEYQLKEPLFEQHAVSVISVDHRKKRAKLSFRFDEKTCFVWVACNILYEDNMNKYQD